MKETQLTDHEVQFFAKKPDALDIYVNAREKLLTAFPDAVIDVQNSQITLRHKRGFAALSLPFRKMKGWPELCVILSIFLDRQIESPRIAVTAHPRHNRWTHPMLLVTGQEVDGAALGWLEEAYRFSTR